MPIIDSHGMSAGLVAKAAKISTKARVIESADEYEVAHEQLAYLIEIHKVHTKFCRCLDCQILQSVTGQLLRRFRATQK